MNKENELIKNDNKSNKREKCLKISSTIENNKNIKTYTPPKKKILTTNRSLTITKQENKKVVLNNKINIRNYSQIKKLKLRKDESTKVNSNTIESDKMISLSQVISDKINKFKRIINSPDVNYNSKSKKKQFSSVESKRYQRRNYEFINNKYKKLITRYFSIKE
jgi:hypothetical protein